VACVTGGGLSTLVPVGTPGARLGATFRQYIGMAVNSIVGSDVVLYSVNAGVELTPVGQAMENGLNAFSTL
jgi:hypothetical protein